MRMNSVRLPASFASITTPELHVVRCVRKELIRHQENFDVSEVYPLFLNRETRGEIFFHRNQTPVFGVEEMMAHHRNYIMVHFCILPLTYQDHTRDIQLPVVMIAYEGGRGWMTELGALFSQVVEIAPHTHLQTIHEMLGGVYDHLRHRMHNHHHGGGGGGGYDYDGHRRWPHGLRVDPHYNFDPNYDAFDEMLHAPPPPLPVRPRRRREATATAPAGGEPAPASTGAGSRSSVPSMPAERVALALARDYINEKEICPITQDSLQYGRVAVTGCLCVFQAEALEGANASQCPMCRAHLVFRVVEVHPKPVPH